MKVIIFKSDRIGDLLNISSILKNLNDMGHDIEIVCSNYNSQIAKYYNFIKKIYIKENLLFFILKNYKILFNKYDVIYQFDGSNWSFRLSTILSSKRKYCLKYLKQKSFLNFKYLSARPSKFLNFFFRNIECIEDYNIENNKQYHYLKLYNKILSLSGIENKNLNHYLPKIDFNFDKKINSFDNYAYIHLDEKWLNYNQKYISSFKNKIFQLAEKKKIIITSNKKNLFLDHFANKNKNILTIYNTSINELLYYIKYADVVVSFHSGFHVHASACLDARYIDILPIEKFNEMDRWIPLNLNYTRFSFQNIDKLIF